MNLENKIIILYQYFYIKYIGDTGYLFVPDKSQLKTINKFITWLDDYYGKNSVGVNKLFEFFIYQFHHYSHPKAIKSKRFLKIGHVIGEKSQERFLNFSNYYTQTDAKQWAIDNEVKFTDIESIINYTDPVSISKLEEIERKRFLNTEYGLVNCLQLTSGYKTKSDTCLECNFSVECRKMKCNGN